MRSSRCAQHLRSAAFVDGYIIGTGLGLVVGGIMFARVLWSFVERGETDLVTRQRMPL